MSFHAAKALGKRPGVAVLAAWADLDAAPDGVPGRIGPFDGRVEARMDPYAPIKLGCVATAKFSSATTVVASTLPNSPGSILNRPPP